MRDTPLDQVICDGDRFRHSESGGHRGSVPSVLRGGAKRDRSEAKALARTVTR